jgi:hypothetical protein
MLEHDLTVTLVGLDDGDILIRCFSLLFRRGAVAYCIDVSLTSNPVVEVNALLFDSLRLRNAPPMECRILSMVMVCYARVRARNRPLS